jgi:hypothetical protein
MPVLIHTQIDLAMVWAITLLGALTLPPNLFLMWTLYLKKKAKVSAMHVVACLVPLCFLIGGIGALWTYGWDRIWGRIIFAGGGMALMMLCGGVALIWVEQYVRRILADGGFFGE